MITPDVKDKLIVVVGLGRSGCAAAALLRRHGAHVIGVDDAEGETVAQRWDREQLGDLADQAFDEVLAGPDWSLRLEQEPEQVVISPGVPPSHATLVDWRSRGLPIHGELEWASRFLTGRSVAVTGTNGKSTTTAWIAHVLRTAGLDSPALGNLGTPLAAEVEGLTADSVAVVECSSFQLETIESWRPDAGLVLNLAPDHLDRYESLADYYGAKARLATQVAADGRFITWVGCDEARGWSHGGQRVLFGADEPESAAWLADGKIRVRRHGQVHDVLDAADLSLQSPPNLLNAAATAAAALPFVGDLDALSEGLRSFKGLAHRHQQVGRRGDVRFVNDTKATNVHAVQEGLRGYPRPVVLIAGGSGKGEDYAPLRDVMEAVRHVVTIGAEGPAIAAALVGVVATSQAEDMDQAVAMAAGLAEPDATVLLSPACASFDMYASYRHRGEAFAAAVRALGVEDD